MRSEGSGFKSSVKSFQQFFLKLISIFYVHFFSTRKALKWPVIDLVDTNFSAMFKALSKLCA